MSNFNFLISDPQFSSFADIAIAAEKILHIDPGACVLNCRRWSLPSSGCTAWTRI